MQQAMKLPARPLPGPLAVPAAAASSCRMHCSTPVTLRLSRRHMVLRAADEPGSSSDSAPSVAPAAPAAPAPNMARIVDMFKGSKTVMAELSGLEFPPNEFKAYAAGLQPKALNKWPGADLATVQAIAARLAAPGAAAADFAADEASLAAVQGLLSNLWRWRRRGGGSLDGEDQRPHQAALEQLHGVQKAAENIDKTSSVILDQLDISDEDKKALGGAIQKVAIGGIQGAVWGSLVAVLAFLVIFNFLRT